MRNRENRVKELSLLAMVVSQSRKQAFSEDYGVRPVLLPHHHHD
jgi:hypothetical protein